MSACDLSKLRSFKWGGRIGNTRDSHRLIELAWSEGGAALQDRVVEALFHAYFEAEANLGDEAVLLAAAVKAGMDESRVRAFLRSDELVSTVDADVARWIDE